MVFEMPMNLEELNEIISDGESSRIEFKRTTGQRSDAAKTVCGMLNGIGGYVIFGMTPAKLSRPHESRPWNPIIANVFYRAGIIEKWGSGTLNIIDWCKGNSNPKPSWTEQSGSLILKFFPNAAAALAVQQEPQQESQQESLRDRVLLLLASGPLSRSEIVAKLGQKQLSRHLYNVMHSLLEEGVIAYTIPDKPKSRLQKYALVRHTGTDANAEKVE